MIKDLDNNSAVVTHYLQNKDNEFSKHFKKEALQIISSYKENQIKIIKEIKSRRV